MRGIARLVVLTLVCACASPPSVREESSAGVPAATDMVDLVVVNLTTTDVIAFVRWHRGLDGRRSPRIRLGAVHGGDTQTFTQPHQGELVSLSLDVPAAPPRSAVGPGPAAATRLLDGDTRGGPTDGLSSVFVAPNGSVGWEISRISPPSVRSWVIR